MRSRARRSRRVRTGLPPGTRAALVAELRADRVRRDRTTRAVVPKAVPSIGVVSSQRRGTASGIAAAMEAARVAGVTATPKVRDGARVVRGQPILVLRGDARRILGVERTVLNLLMHLSGVATMTAEAARRARPLEVYGTRKTLPGLRDLEKAAIVHGGGHPHRRDLSSGLLVKNNHLALVPLSEAVRRAARVRRAGERVQVEVRSPTEALAAVRAGADALLIDNAGPGGARRIVRALKVRGLRRGVWIELSGGITPANIGRYRNTGADAASLGSITHSAVAVPFHLTLRRARSSPGA